MKLVGAAGQNANHYTVDASGTIASSTLPQLILPRAFSRSSLFVQNLHATLPMYLEFGSARATATITAGVITAVTVTNPGFGFSVAPTITFRGGGAVAFPSFVGATDPFAPPAPHVGAAHCVMTGAAPNMSVASITIDNGGSGYLVPPYVLILNRHIDPNGCADPSVGAGSGILLPPNGASPYYANGTTCTTDQASLFCSTGIGAKFTCKWMD